MYPGVKTEHNFVVSIPADVEYVRMQGDFEYLSGDASHHAAKVLKVPNPAFNTDAPSAGLAPPQVGG